MKEREFQKWVTDTAEALGWRCWHVPAPMRPLPGGKGFVPEPRARGLCDLIMLHPDPPRLILAEVKSESGKLSDEQREFLRLAREVANAVSYFEPRTIGVYFWRPGEEALIEEILKAKVMIP